MKKVNNILKEAISYKLNIKHRYLCWNEYWNGHIFLKHKKIYTLNEINYFTYNAVYGVNIIKNNEYIGTFESPFKTLPHLSKP